MTGLKILAIFQGSDVCSRNPSHRMVHILAIGEHPIQFLQNHLNPVSAGKETPQARIPFEVQYQDTFSLWTRGPLSKGASLP